MFDRVNNENLEIDEFFTYFTPKIVFSIEKVNDLPFKSKQLQNKVYVTFRLDLFEALPEVTLMRVLHNTKNAVICLSATSGFKYSFNGNYCRPVMAKYGSDAKNNLDYRSISRTNADAEKLRQLRECRAEARKVSIKEFVDTENNRITEARNNSEFSACYNRWLKELKEIKGGFNTKNPYRINAFKRQIEAMLLTAFDQKNSLVLSLNNGFGWILRNYIKSENGRNENGFKLIDEETYKVFEIIPFDNEITLRVILFDADLAKNGKVEEYLKLENEKTKIAFISSYKSAGTGLNLFTRYKNENLDEDFERLVLINSPFYSNVFTDTGLNSIENYVLLLKHYADESSCYLLKDFDVNLVHGRNYKILMQEHAMSSLKDVMQAVGRIERRDTYMNTEIFLPSDVIDDLAIQFSRLKKDGNELIFQSMSLLNYELKEYCLQKVDTLSFKNSDEREKFSAQMESDYDAIESFFNHDFMRYLDAARQGDKSATKLNEALRSIECIKNPQRYIQTLLNLPEIKPDDCVYFKNIFQKFYLNLEDIKNVRVCSKENNPKALTDLNDGDRVYKPYQSLLPNYHKAISHEQSTAYKLLKPIFDLEKKLSKEILPHPAMLPIFKGNIGEYMFAQCLELINVKPLTIDEIFMQLSPLLYEQFDFYVLSEDTLFCIDVKNWSSGFDKENLARETHEKALRKAEMVVEKVTRERKLQAEFLYINTYQDRNAINSEQEIDDNKKIHYMNLFKVISQYEEVKAEKPNPKRKSTLENRLDINMRLIERLGGILNG